LPDIWAGDVGRDEIGRLYLGVGALRGRLWGAVFRDGRFEGLSRLILVGAGMHRVELNPHVDSSTSEQIGAYRRERWSRTIGALGDEATWLRLTRLRVGVVGCGRSGSMVASAVAHLGVRHLTLVDADLVERHNLGEAGGSLTDKDVGRPKVIAVADHLSDSLGRTGLIVNPIVNSITDLGGLVAVKACDVVFTCVDHDAPRLAAALIAVTHARVLLDVGTSVQVGRPERFSAEPRDMGADIRLIVPGDGCLVCRGGLSDLRGALRGVYQNNRGSNIGRDFGSRSGSLRSLNQIATGVAIRLLEDLVAERVCSSTWARIDVQVDGTMSLQYPLTHSTALASCPVCARLGLGDAAL
jgi:molybdopterin/thiamine biosynthesis adenylyltransferase